MARKRKGAIPRTIAITHALRAFQTAAVPFVLMPSCPLIFVGSAPTTGSAAASANGPDRRTKTKSLQGPLVATSTRREHRRRNSPHRDEEILHHPSDSAKDSGVPAP